MIELFKEEVNLGDNVKLILTTGNEPIGVVIGIGTNHVLIRNKDGNSTRIFEVLIGGWEIIKNVENPPIILKPKEAEVEQNKTGVEKALGDENKDEKDIKDDLENNQDEKVPKKAEVEQNKTGEEKDSEDKNTTSENGKGHKKLGLTVIGKIPLEKLETKKKNLPEVRTYRLRQVAQKFSLPIQSIVSILEKEKVEVENNPNFKIDQNGYDIINKSLNQIKPIDMGKIYEDSVKELEPKGLILNSFDQLNLLKEKIEINVSKQTLPGNARIKRYGTRHKYGFVTDNEGLDYHFHFSEIQDYNLLEKLQSFGAEGTQVICQLHNFNGKLIAKKLYLPKTVEFFHSKAVEFFVKDDFNSALELIELILLHFPDYSLSIELKNKIRYNKIKKRTGYQKTSDYLLARIENKKGHADLAKKHYLQAIEINDQKAEYAIKELAYLLSGEGKYDEAIGLVINHSKKIKSSDPNSFIAYFYEAKKDYDNAIEYLKKIKPKSHIDKLKLFKRLAICYFGTGNYKLAEIEVYNVLSIQPKDAVTTKLKQALEIAKAKGSEEEIESIFKEAEISAITGGLSKYIYHTLENCEYAGVPASEVAEEKFNERTLTNLKKYIETIKDGRPRERAEAYLSQAKIEQIIDSENSRDINSSLARFCTSIAISWATEGRQVSTLRYFILEAASLEPIYDILRRYIPLYLHSYSLPSFESKSKIRQNWTELIEEVVADNDSQAFWFGVLDLLLVNSKFSTQFLTSIYNKIDYRDTSLKFLMPYLAESIKGKMNKNLFLQLWKKGREKLKREKDTLSAKFLALEQSKSTEAIIESFFNIIKVLPEWFDQLDKQRLDTLNGIIETIVEFNKQQAFEDKERYYNISINQLLQLKEEIQESPTEISFNVFISVIDFINNLLDYEFKNVIETSKPIIRIQIYGEGSINKSTGLVDVQFSISNKKGSAPISYLELNIKNENGIEFIQENNVVYQSLRGGDEKVLKVKLRIKNELIEEGATNLKIVCFYKIRGNEELLNQKEELTLRFYSASDFEKIENPFAVTADSGPVEDSSMFYGREEFISDIKESIINSKSKCVIIYGQKRSGKSSVLHHLRENLNNSTNTFCVSFSLGEIIDDLTSKAFYYTILTEIEDSLALLSNQRENVPQYIAPNYTDLNEAPAIMFNDQIKLLRREFIKYPDWANKKLVLLIDEFTYIYTAIKKDYLSEQFMKTWKSFLEKGFFTSVLIGQDIMPKFKAEYPNEFGVTEDKRLSYLKKSDAIKLIEEPIWDKTKNRSRFLGKATELILEYTSSNPYYVQIFCARLVEYMNHNKAISVTEADVRDVAESFIIGEQALTADKFDNLLTAGDADLDAFDPNDVLSALKAIAIASKNLDSCPREAINLGEVDYEENILQDLKDREVLSIPQPGYFKINVRLFKEWLLIN